MERFTKSCSYWALSQQSCNCDLLSWRATQVSIHRVTFKQSTFKRSAFKVGITVDIKYSDLISVRIENEMAGTSQKRLGSSAPQLSMPLGLPGWLDQKDLCFCIVCLLDNFPSFAHSFCCPKFSGSAYSTQGMGFRPGKHRIKKWLGVEDAILAF